MTLFVPTMAATGPVGPLEKAFAIHALPHTSTIDEMKPTRNSFPLNSSTSCQYQAPPVINMIVLATKDEENEFVSASNPISG